MAGSLNKVVLIGNLGRDPEIRSTSDGREIANFSIATSESWKDKATGERKDKTEWHRIVVFNEGLVRVIKNYVKKGSKLYIEGQLQTRKWMDNENQERYTTEIVLQNFNSTLILLDAKGDNNNFQGEEFQRKEAVPAFDNSDLDDEIPF
jgi:single-strand DNA-binding protein